MVFPRQKYRIYNDANLLSTTLFPPTVATAIVAQHHASPAGPHATFLGLRAEAVVTVDVNAPGGDIPPEFWWTQTFVNLNAFFVPGNSLTVNGTFGTSKNYLGSTILKPTRAPLETNAGEYTIVWTGDEALKTGTYRHNLAISVGPTILLQVTVYDPQFVFSMAWADVSVNVATRLFTLWEDPA